MDLQTMESQVFNVLRDTARSFFDKEEIDAWLNEAQLDLAVRLNLLQHQWSGTTSGNTIAIPTSPTLVYTTSLRLASTGVTFVDSETFDENADNGRDPATTIARVFSGVFELYPTPATGTAYTIRGSKEPTTLVDPEDTSELPAQLHRKLTDYAKYQALLKDGSDRWQAYAADYERGLPDIPSGIVKLSPGPLFLTRAPGPWDVDPERTHV